MLNKLIRIANLLDIKGLYTEADLVDEILVLASITSARSNLIRALKNDDQPGAMHALTSLVGQSSNSAETLGMDSGDFKEFANAIKDGKLGIARKLFGVEQDVKIDPMTHNPVTQQPWSSGPILTHPKRTNFALLPNEQRVVEFLVGKDSLDDLEYKEAKDIYGVAVRIHPHIFPFSVTAETLKALADKMRIYVEKRLGVSKRVIDVDFPGHK